MTIAFSWQGWSKGQSASLPRCGVSTTTPTPRPTQEVDQSAGAVQTGTTTYTWDSLYRMTSNQNGAGQSVGYGYDLEGRLTTITYPGNKVVTRGYDDADRLTEPPWVR